MGFFGIFGRVIVDGTSMQPTYNPLDWLLVHYGFFGKKLLFLRLGDVVVIERGTQPGIFYVKRIAEIAIDNSGEKKGKKSYYVLSDNEAGTDSRKWGFLSEAEIIGNVITRIKKN
jgi:signal peptidase I